jgi:hypothetical protein
LTSRRLIAAALVAAGSVALVACTSSKSLTQEVTTTTAAPTTTGAPQPSYPAPPPTPISIPRATEAGSPDGSGCDPPSSQTLHDGIWFGVLKTVDANASTIGLDLACFFSATPPASTTSGTGSTTTTTAPPNDFHITNNNPTVYLLKVAPQVAVLSLAQSGTGGDGQFNPTTTGVASANAILTDQSQKYVWVQVTRGYVTVIQGQFTP